MQLPQTSAGGPFTIMATSHSSGEKALLQNVMFGDVFFCSGQSNMQVGILGYKISSWWAWLIGEISNFKNL
jgi:sialate O-acetylesterase